MQRILYVFFKSVQTEITLKDNKFEIGAFVIKLQQNSVEVQCNRLNHLALKLRHKSGTRFCGWNNSKGSRPGIGIPTTTSADIGFAIAMDTELSESANNLCLEL